jgi:RNA polymerase sigma factor (sigma-70 family)
VDERHWLADRFERQRPQLTAIAYRMLGSHSDAHDAVQEAWLRLQRSATDGVDNLAGWLTTVVSRVCLDMLRQRASRREHPYGVHLPDPIVEPWPRADRADGTDPEHQTALSDAVGLALLVVLDTLSPAERLAFVLHDMFGVPFDTIAVLLDRTPAATKMLASRARRRVQGSPTPDTDLARQREVVDAFFAATRDGDFDALLALLDPEAIMRVDLGTGPKPSRVVSGAVAIVKRALAFAWRRAQYARPALVNGAAGIVVANQDQPLAIMGLTIARGKITEIEILADTSRLRQLDLPDLDN